MSDRTTARAQRRQAVADGAASDAVDRRSPRRDPGGQTGEATTRNRQLQLQRDIEADLDLDAGSVGAVDRLTGMDAMLRSPGQRQWGARLRDDFASEADFVEREDVDPGIDPQEISATPGVARDRRDRVAQRAREQTAADAQFLEPDDLDADVGARGVSGIEVAEDRRSAVADRTRQQLAAEDPFAEPDDFEAQVGPGGIESAGLTDTGQRRRAGRQFEQETPLGAVDPTDDLVRDGDAFALAGGAQRRVAAREFEDDLDLFGRGELDPETDIRDTNGGFGLAEDPAREVAAEQLDERVDDRTVRAGDIDLEETDDGAFEAIFRGER